MNSIDFKSLLTTRNELLKVNNNELVDEIIRILNNNEIKKPSKHNRLDDKETSRYKIDLKSEHIEVITELFADLEVKTLNNEYESTNESAKFSSILDKWNNILES